MVLEIEKWKEILDTVKFENDPSENSILEQINEFQSIS